MKNQMLLVTLCLVAACGDKDTLDSVDTNPKETGETETTGETGETGDSPVETTTCVNPDFVDSKALAWTAAQKYSGYTATVTNTHVLVADPSPGVIYGVPWVATDGQIEGEADFSLTTTSFGIDKAMWSEGYVGISDALATNADGVVSGAAHIFKEETLDALSGEWSAADVADISIYGPTLNGYTGALLVADVDGDALLDALVTTGPLPGMMAIFLNIEGMSGAYAWNDANFVLDDICVESSENDVQYQSTNLKIFGFGSGDGYLAVGCPSGNFRGGEVLIFDLPLQKDSDPIGKITNVTGWRMDSNGYGEPLYVDNRVPDEIVVVTDNKAKGFNLDIVESPEEDSEWWGTSPTVTMITNDEGETCRYIAVGDQAYEEKGTETGALYASLLDANGLPVEWVTATIPSPEGIELLYTGAVNEFSPDGSYLMSVGWKRGNEALGSGVMTTSMNY